MKKRMWRLMSLVMAGVLLGSSIFAVQQMLPTRPVVQAQEFTYQPEPQNDVIVVVKSQPVTEEKVRESKKEESVTRLQAAPAAAQVKKATVAEVKPEPAKTLPAATEPYRLGAVRTNNLLTRITVQNKGETTATNIRIQIPLIQSNSVYQVQKGEKFSVEPAEIQILEGARVGIFNLQDLEPGAETVLELRYNLQAYIVEFFANYVPKDTGNLPEQYLKAANRIESDDQGIISLAGKLTAGLNTDWDKAQAITRWVATNITYDAAAANRNSGALQALQTRKGVCEDYAALSAALARAAGIPARIVYGFTDNGTKWPATGPFALRGFRHAWVEYYLDGRGWVPAEPTRSSAKKLYFGTLPHNRYIVQNYNDISLKGKYAGGKLAFTWTETLE